MNKNLIITLISAGTLALGATGIITIPKAVAKSNYQKGLAAEELGNTEEALSLYEASAKRHNADALYRLGQIYMDDSTTWSKGVAAYTEAYERGKIEAASPLAKALLTGKGVEKDAKKGFAYAKEAADLEDVEACMIAGYCYENGLGTVRDEKKAFEYYQHSATQDNPDGLYCLACCYKNGIGVERDAQKGQSLIEESAQLGSEFAIECLRQQELERQRQAAEQKRLAAEQRRLAAAQKRAYDNQMVTCPKCHGNGYYYDRYSRKSIWCIICCGKGRCTRKDVADYDEIPFW